MKNLSVGLRLTIAFVLVSLFTTLVAVVGWMGVSETKTYLDNQTKIYIPSIDAVAKMRFNLRNLVVAQRTLLYPSLTDAERARQHDNFAAARDAYRKAIDAYAPLPQTPDEAVVWKQFEEALKPVVEFNNEVMRLIRKWEGDKSDQATLNKATEMVLNQGRDLNRTLNELIGKVFEINIKNADADENLAEAANKRMVWIMTTLAILAPLLSIGFGWLITRSIVGPLGKNLAFAQAVGAGSLDSKLDVASRDEVGRLADALRDMVGALKAKIAEADRMSREAAEEAERARLAGEEAAQAKARAERAKSEGLTQAAGKLSGVVEATSSASEELSAQVEQSSRGSEVQAQRISETATAMEEMNATVLEVAQNATRAAETSDAARKEADAGAALVDRVIKGISTVYTQSQGMKVDMTNLGVQAQGIGRILNVISDIADQTNLLALNAAIEAARAGEAGRGFAVVADEVRKLAEKTMTATKEVDEAIRGVQQGADKNIQNVDQTGETIESITTLAAESGDALKRIVGMVVETSDQVRSIATASEEQSSASEEINRAVEEISRISSENADAMRQSAQAVSELAKQSQILRRLIEELKADGAR